MTYFVVVFADPQSNMDSGCRNGILSEIKAHGGVIKEFFSLHQSDPPDIHSANHPNAYDGREEIEWASPEERKC